MKKNPTPVTAYLGLGSNLADRQQAMRSAVRMLMDHPDILIDTEQGVASLYETSPVETIDRQPDYLNSVVCISTKLDAHNLLEVLMAIEKTVGRVRLEPRGARVIDIDLLFYNDLVVHEDELTLPHPRLHQRRFVLEPLCEVASQFIHPVLQVSVEQLARELRTAHDAGTVVPVAGNKWAWFTAT